MEIYGYIDTIHAYTADVHIYIIIIIRLVNIICIDDLEQSEEDDGRDESELFISIRRRSAAACVLKFVIQLLYIYTGVLII